MWYLNTDGAGEAPSVMYNLNPYGVKETPSLQNIIIRNYKGDSPPKSGTMRPAFAGMTLSKVVAILSSLNADLLKNKVKKIYYF